MHEPIRVLHVVGRMDRGGIETFIMNIYRKIDRTKVQFDFLCHYGREADYNDEIRRLGGRIYEMPTIKSENKVYYKQTINYIKALNSFFKIHRYKIIHGHMTNTAILYMPIAKKYGAKTLIAHSHLSKSKKGLMGHITNIIQKPISKLATNYFACSISAAEWLFTKSILQSGKVKLINNSIDVEKFRYNEKIRNEVRRTLNLNDELIIGHVGRFYHEKNHEFLIDLLNRFKEEDKNVKLLLVGDGPLKENIVKKSYDLGLSENVIFLGNRSDVNDVMQAFDVFVMPSFFEGLPVVTVEAQASGLPCVFSNTITGEANITNKSVYLSLSEDLKVWTNTIDDIFLKHVRKDTSEIISNKGYNVLDNSLWLQNFYMKNI